MARKTTTSHNKQGDELIQATLVHHVTGERSKDVVSVSLERLCWLECEPLFLFNSLELGVLSSHMPHVALFWGRLSSTLHVYLSNSPPMQIFIGAQQLKELLSYKKVKGRSQAANAENCIQCGPWSDTSGHWIVGQSLFSSGTYIVFLHKASSQLQAHCSWKLLPKCVFFCDLKTLKHRSPINIPKLQAYASSTLPLDGCKYNNVPWWLKTDNSYRSVAVSFDTQQFVRVVRMGETLVAKRFIFQLTAEITFTDFPGVVF